ncbi:hypothetical protein [Kordiimonas aestuarii]|uniref:hypothetical protein n=1 Tax=Kordiimonas aestuarii TaxID=1005925 RepID=UPI0021D362A5|nr:hypothetical protein [Kordiimonas aestuarii]
MPADFNMTAVLAVMYTVFLSQIYLISVHYPRKMCARIREVVESYPPAEYPHLYPGPYVYYAESARKHGLKIFMAANYIIAAIGLGILCMMMLSGYEPALLGGDEIFVMFYFILQASPLLYIQITEWRYYALMRESFTAKHRSASLAPRRMSQFVSPALVGAAIVFYVLWLVFYLSDQGPVATWSGEVYATLAVITGINVFYVLYLRRMVFGKKVDPYRSDEDRDRQIRVMGKVYGISSIGISLFLAFTQAADRFGFEVFDPVLISFYLQLCIVAGLGFVFRDITVNSLNFKVYRKQADEPS